jgi:surfeit locus 1 family protein
MFFTKDVHSRPLSLSVLSEFAYRRVLLSGRWDHARSILIGPRVRDGTTGYHIITPLMRENGSTVLVDRGFVSKDAAHKVMTPSDTDDSKVRVYGILRTGQARNRFTPDNHPEKGEWYWLDIGALADHAGGEAAGVQPVLVEEIFSTQARPSSSTQFVDRVVDGHGGEAASRIAKAIPVGRSPTVDLPNSHLSYLITWYVTI